MSDRPDWADWILQKNAEAEQEELRKSSDTRRKDSVSGEHQKREPLCPHCRQPLIVNRPPNGLWGGALIGPDGRVVGKFTRDHQAEIMRQEEAMRRADVERIKKLKKSHNEDFTATRPDWQDWLLQKNAEAEQEELRKSSAVLRRKGPLPAAYDPNAPHVAASGAGSSDDDDDSPQAKENARRNYYAHASAAAREAKRQLEEPPKHPAAKQGSAFTMNHVNEIAATRNHAAAKKRAHEIVDSSAANHENKAKMKLMIDSSRNSTHLAQGMTNFALAHPSEKLRVIKSDEENSEESV